MVKTNLKVVEPRSPQREALAAAIAHLAQAEDALGVARDAKTKVRDRGWAAQDRLEALREEHRAAIDDPAAAYISAMKEGREAATLELEAPTKSRATAESEVQREIDALNATREALSEAIVDRDKAFAAAKSKVAVAVSEVMLSEIDVLQMLAQAESAAEDIVSRRCELMQLQSLLPASEEKAAIARFLSRQWLLQEYNNEHVFHHSALAIIASRDALMRDADAELPR
jgi:hypothetical protein